MTFDELREKWKLPARVGSVDGGWVALLDEAFTRLSEVGVCIPEDVTCIKEKLAGLRLYLHPAQEGRKQVSRIIHDIEHRSYQTCERCGEPGVVRQGSWLKCLCEKHGEGREEFKPMETPVLGQVGKP